MKRLSKVQIQEVCQRYIAGESTTLLATLFGVSATAINGLLTRRGITLRTNGETHRKFTCDYTFFSAIDTEVKAYWLGFLAADGYIDSRDNAVVLNLALEDQNHLLHFADALKSTSPVRIYKYPTVSLARITLHSEELLVGLATYGIVNNKTFTIHWPDLSSELLRHFLRGYIDGDGGFYMSATASTTHKNVIFSVTSNEQFLEGMQQFLMTTLGLPKTKHTQRHKDVAIFTLRYCGRNQVARIVTWLYQDATVYLLRKYIKIMDYLRAIPLR